MPTNVIHTAHAAGQVLVHARPYCPVGPLVWGFVTLEWALVTLVGVNVIGKVMRVYTHIRMHVASQRRGEHIWK